jgi:hypothetical protein
MSPRTRKVVLTTHVVTSVGWLGAVAAVLALALAAVISDDEATVRGAYIAMQLVGWAALLPLSLASLLSGLVQAAGTSWGVLQHYWVVTKLLMNVLAIVVLVMYTQTLGSLADLARGGGSLADLRDPSPVLHSVAALLLLVVATILAIYKPRGRTRYGERKQRSAREA